MALHGNGLQTLKPASISSLKRTAAWPHLCSSCANAAGIAGVKGNQLQLMTSSDDVMQALIRDIQLARHNIEMVFYIWQPGGMADQSPNH